MRLILENGKNISVTRLPNSVDGNYWIVNDNKNLLNVEAENGKWVIKSNPEVKISKSLVNDKLSNVDYMSVVNLENYDYYYLTNVIDNEMYILYVLPSYEKMENFVVDYNQVNNISIGNKDCDINIVNGLINNKQLLIEYDKKSGNTILRNINLSNKLYVNTKICNECVLSNGDIIFIVGVYIYYLGNILLIGNNKNDLSFNSMKLNRRLININPDVDYSNNIDKDIKLYDSNKYYQRPPRFKRKIETKVFNIDAPTQKENQEDMPLIFTIAPMLTMGMMSMVTGMTALQKVLNGDSTLKEEFTSLLMCGCMLLAMVVFPLAQKFYTKVKKKQKERKRRRKYKKYIDKKREEIFAEINYQKQVLIEDNLPIEKVRDIILNRSRNLWERKLEHADFLELRLGIGNKKPDMEIKYPEEHFTLEEDNLKDIITDLVNESKDLVDVPITLNFRQNNKVGIIGDKLLVNSFLDNLMLQVMAYHGYDMLRIVILTNDSNKSYWDKFRNLSYLWNNDKSLRYYACNKDEINKLTSYLREEYNYRLDTIKENKKDIMFVPYYLILSDDVNLVKNNIFIKDILELNGNIGYSVVMCVEKLDLLPNECSMFINVSRDINGTGLFTNQMTNTNQIAFNPDLVYFSLRNSITNISNIPVDINDGKFALPTKYSFLEMYDVGNVKQLNILSRWKNNDIINSLSCPVGIDEQGELFNIDLHEKAHGPHGLVAGMTGSGKSEWIITYILSMAINYSPEEVQFVLIDYKGGGLALTFDNVEIGVKLPHVVGTLTNLDVVEMNRSLASINSELKRRQTMFKSAREELNESSMDIYKYQEYYRAGKLSEPMSHLFIISDEFAELKAQQPDFMDELISTARIGRSLGVHLILATQKPSGVVNDQIWSNSKFKVCLKVQDKSDSSDMIKCPDAAMLKETGRFYLLVGFNEFFAKGQAAYAGMPYFESEKKITTVDANIDFVDNIGSILKKSNIEKNNTQYIHKGEELPNILNYIIETSKTQNFKINPLWLTRIPNVIYVDKLKIKYNWEKENYVLNPIIGEYDLPSKQTQGLLTLPISRDGNVLIYGMSGSGKELLLTTILYSLMSDYSPFELNTYILDFGSEVLNNFKNAPHVGDIIHSGDDEKIENLFKFIKTNISTRRKLFSDYNGNYGDYIKSDKEKLPNILVIINQFEVFQELYIDYSEFISEITRDCAKYGLFIILTSSSVNGIRTKISQNFKTIISLQLNSEYDYRGLFGNTNGIVPSKAYGRGLIKLDSVVEFQTAYANDKDVLYDTVKNFCMKLLVQNKMKAVSIPVLPDVVTYADINKVKISINNIPIGIEKKSLNIENIVLKDELSFIISARTFDSMSNFIDKLFYIMDYNKIKSFVFDTKNLYEKIPYANINYNSVNLGVQLNRINNYVNDVYKIFEENSFNVKSIDKVDEILCVIVGLDRFISILSDNDKKIFDNICEKTKEINKIKFIFIDIPSGFKKYEYEPWYKNIISKNSGLWIGDGVSSQNIINGNFMSKIFYESIGNKYGYIVYDGNINFIKVIEKIK